jgi:hypothetical protein
MLKIKPNHLMSLVILALTSLQASAQAYYPYNVADYPGRIDRGQPVYGYPQSNYDNPAYQQGSEYYSNRGYPQDANSYYGQGSGQAYNNQSYAQDRGYNNQGYYNQAPTQSYPQASGYYYPGTAQGYNRQPQAAPQNQTQAQQYNYAYQQRPAYPPQAYYQGYPRSNNNGMKKIFKPEKWRGRNFGEEFWPGDDSIYEDVLPLHGPWDRNWGKAPWNREYEDLWGDEGGPDAWFDFADPKEGLAWMWEDFLYTPNALGTMPGGWEAPSISVPNPVDVGDEFKNAAGDFPGEMKDFADGFTYGDRTVTGSKPKKDGGSFGMGKKKDGINISPKQR